MFKFYSGLLKLDHEHVQKIANIICNELSPDYAKNDPEWFKIFIDQTIFFWENPSKIKNPITVLLANGWLHGIHPGTTRFLGSILAKEKTIPVLAVCHTDPSTPKTLERYLIDYKETDNYHFYTERPGKNTFQLKTRDEIATLDEPAMSKVESLDEVVNNVLWSKEPNIRWVDLEGNMLYEVVTNPNQETKVIEINNFNEFWESLINIATS